MNSTFLVIMSSKQSEFLGLNKTSESVKFCKYFAMYSPHRLHSKHSRCNRVLSPKVEYEVGNGYRDCLGSVGKEMTLQISKQIEDIAMKKLH